MNRLKIMHTAALLRKACYQHGNEEPSGGMVKLCLHVANLLDDAVARGFAYVSDDGVWEAAAELVKGAYFSPNHPFACGLGMYAVQLFLTDEEPEYEQAISIGPDSNLYEKRVALLERAR